MPPPLASQTTVKRIHREVADIRKEELGQITLAPTENNLFLWRATIPGPAGSVYEGGVYSVDLQLANDYPFTAPKVTFTTRIYHMNISDRGHVCIDILKNNWSPALSLFKVVLSLSSLLTDPNPMDPLVPSIATEYVRNRAQHDSTARHWTALYAKPPSSDLPEASSSNQKEKKTTNRKAKGKGKGKGKSRSKAVETADDDQERAEFQVGGSRDSTIRSQDPIEISDSDDESHGGNEGRTGRDGKSGRRKRRRTVSEEALSLEDTMGIQKGKKSIRNDPIINLLDEGCDLRMHKRGKVAGTSTAGRTGSTHRLGDSEFSSRAADDIIVIED